MSKVGDDDFPIQSVSFQLECELDQVYQEIKAGQISQPYINLDNLFNDLNKSLDKGDLPK